MSVIFIVFTFGTYERHTVTNVDLRTGITEILGMPIKSVPRLSCNDLVAYVGENAVVNNPLARRLLQIIGGRNVKIYGPLVICSAITSNFSTASLPAETIQRLITAFSYRPIEPNIEMTVQRRRQLFDALKPGKRRMAGRDAKMWIQGVQIDLDICRTLDKQVLERNDLPVVYEIGFGVEHSRAFHGCYIFIVTQLFHLKHVVAQMATVDENGLLVSPSVYNTFGSGLRVTHAQYSVDEWYKKLLNAD